MKCVALSSDNFNEGDIRTELLDVIKPGMKVVCIPFASDNDWLVANKEEDLGYYGTFMEDKYKPFYDFGIAKSDFYIARQDDLMKFVKWKIQNADIIYFTGGSMDNLMNILLLSGLYEFIKDISKDKVFIGVSAGALAMCTKYYDYSETEDSPVEIKKGLGLIPDIRFMVHHHEGLNDVVKKLLDIQISELVDNPHEDPILVLLKDGEGVLYEPASDNEFGYEICKYI